MNRGRLDARTTIALAVTLLFWSSAFPFIRIALRAYSPAHVTLLRFLFASVAVGVYAIAVRLRFPARADLPAIVFVGFLNVAAYHTLLNHGLVTVRAGSGSLIVNTAPVFACLFATMLLGERVGLRGWAGLGISLCGTALIAAGEGRGFDFPPGAFLLAACAVTWGLSMVALKPLLVRYSATQIAVVSIWAGTIMLCVSAPGLAGALRHAPASATWVVAYLGVFPIAIAYITWSYALARMPATRAAGYTYLIPVFAIVVAYFLLGETPGKLTVAGGGIALLGVALANGGSRKE